MQETPVAELAPPAPVELEAVGRLYDRFAVGEFRDLDRNRVRWIPPGPTWTGPDLFEFIPKQQRPFAFIRPNGEEISPRNMIRSLTSARFRAWRAYWAAA